MNDKEKELYFLQIVRVNGNIYHLTRDGWSYKDIFSTLSRLSLDGIVRVEETKTRLTQKGNVYYRSLCKQLGKKGIARYLSIDNNRKRTLIPKDGVYIPQP